MNNKNNIHLSFKFFEIKINQTDVAYYNKYNSSFLCMDKNGNVFGKKIDNNFENIPDDCIFIKKTVFKGDALDACNVCNNNNNTINLVYQNYQN